MAGHACHSCQNRPRLSGLCQPRTRNSERITGMVVCQIDFENFASLFLAIIVISLILLKSANVLAFKASPHVKNASMITF